MKIALLIGVAICATLVQVVAAIPHGAHRKLHVKKAYTTDIVTQYTTVTVPEYVVWVDDKGNVVSTETMFSGYTTSTPTPEPVSSTPDAITTSAPPTSSPASDSAPTTSSIPVVAVPTTPTTPIAPVEPTSTSVAAPSTSAAPPAPPPAPTTEAPASTQFTPLAQAKGGPESQGASDNQGISNVLGIAYDVLKGANPPSCATESQIASDISFLASQGYGLVRIYDVTCNQVQLVTQYASQNGMKVFVTVPSITNLAADLPNVISQAADNKVQIDTIAIGNELVQSGLATADAVVAALGLARTLLAGLGYTGSIVTVDTFDVLQNNPGLCQASDYCAANCHAFFSASTTAAGAGNYVQQQAAAVSQANGGKLTVITESGWPWNGQTNGDAVPSPENQQTAIASLTAAFPRGGITLFEAYDADYKSPGAFGVEPSWGIYGR